MASVTVGIPFYAESKPGHFQAAVDSILSQTMQPDEVHLIQDGPVGQELGHLVSKYVQRRNVELIEIAENRGLSHALNLSILEAKSTYYTRMDADDISFSERIEKQVAFLEAHPTIDILGTAAIEFRETPDEENTFLKKMPEAAEEIERMVHYRTPFIHPSVMFRRSVFATVGLYGDHDKMEDVEFWIRALKQGVQGANLSEPLIYYRTEGVIGRRSEVGRAIREFAVRFGYSTFSPKLNSLKLLAFLFRLMPPSVQEWGYRRFR